MEQNIQPSLPQQPVTPQTPAPRSPILMMVLIGVIMLGMGLGGGYFLFANKNFPVTNTQSTTQASPTPSTERTDAEEYLDPTEAAKVQPLNDTTTWKVYKNDKNKFTFKYPTTYEIITETPQKITFGFRFTPDDTTVQPVLTVTMDNSVSYSQYPACNGKPTDKCIQKKEAILIDNQKSERVSLSGGVDYAEESVQIPSKPIIEMRMNIAGGGLSNTFTQILSTFKFIN